MGEPIRGKIAKIFTPYKVAINRGKEHGVKVGMRFTITTPEIQVRDPDSKEVLGEIHFEKGRIRIEKVYEKFSIGTGSVIISMISFPQPQLIRERLNVSAADVEWTDEVRVGDIVIEIISEKES